MVLCFISWLLNLDQELFLLINGNHCAFLDFIMWWASDKFVWIPFYGLLLFWLVRSEKNKWWLVLLFIPFLVTLTDQISVHFFKDYFQRLRPCHEPLLNGLVRILNGRCGGQFGFISSHAANSFGLAMFASVLLWKKRKYAPWILFIPYALLMSYSRIYLGNHYPGDVIVGLLLGCAIGMLCALLYLYIKKLLNSKIASNNP